MSDQDQYELFVERCAIIEIEAGKSQADAALQAAFAEWLVETARLAAN